MEKVPARVQVVLATVLVCAVGVISLMFVCLVGWLMLGMAGAVPFSRMIDPRVAVTVFGVSLAMICGLLWAATIAEVVRLSNDVERRLWKTLIVGVLTAVVGSLATGLR